MRHPTTQFKSIHCSTLIVFDGFQQIAFCTELACKRIVLNEPERIAGQHEID